jgi:ketosteroid isomerase-like protein
VTTSAQRLDALISAQQVRDLPARYAAAYARLDAGELVRLYAPDVELLDGRRGRPALREHFEAGMRNTGGAGLYSVILHTGSHLIEFTGTDTAVGSVYCLGEMQRTDGSWYRQAIIYTDDYTRQDGTWYFARQRRHELVYGAPPLTRPNHLPPANWPASQTGRGTLPGRWPTWQQFWESPD